MTVEKSKIKCVYANGDSFVFGQGLDPVGQTHFYDFTKKLRNENWTGVVASNLGVDLDNDYYNDALPGGSNDRIVRTTLSKLPELLEKYKPEEILVLIGWTDASRTEFYFAGQEPKYYPFLSNNYPKQHDKTPMKVETKLHELYYGFFNDLREQQDRLTQQLLLLQLYLQTIGVTFLFTNSLFVFASKENNYFDFFSSQLTLPKSSSLINSKYYLSVPNCAQFMFERNIPELPCRHPTTNGHIKWAEYVMDYLSLNKIL